MCNFRFDEKNKVKGGIDKDCSHVSLQNRVLVPKKDSRCDWQNRIIRKSFRNNFHYQVFVGGEQINIRPDYGINLNHEGSLIRKISIEIIIKEERIMEREFRFLFDYLLMTNLSNEGETEYYSGRNGNTQKFFNKQIVFFWR